MEWQRLRWLVAAPMLAIGGGLLILAYWADAWGEVGWSDTKATGLAALGLIVILLAIVPLRLIRPPGRE